MYRNLGNGRFEDISERLGPPVTTPAAGRGAAFADLDNDGDTDVVVNNVHAEPDLFRLDSPRDAHWMTLKLVGTRSNRSAIGARVRLVSSGGVQVQEVRGGGSYYSQNDLRVHFGLGRSASVERLEIRWPSGLEERWTEVGIDRIVHRERGNAASRCSPENDSFRSRTIVRPGASRRSHSRWRVLAAQPLRTAPRSTRVIVRRPCCQRRVC